MRPDPKPKTLKPVRANAGVRAAYQKRIDALVAEMHRSLAHWIAAAYRKTPPEMAQDAPPDASGGSAIPRRQSPARSLQDVVRRLTRRWQDRFDEAAPELAKYFATAVTDRSDVAMRTILKNAGFTVQFKLTKSVNDVLQATVAENVSLIKSIAAQHLTQVEGVVMRSVQTGRDLATLTNELERQFGVTRRRAAFISLDQNNKATAAIQRVRYVDLGITEAVWVHSGGGKTQRPSHVRAGRERERFDTTKGWFDPAVQQFILPGELPNCRCVSRPVVPGFG